MNPTMLFNKLFSPCHHIQPAFAGKAETVFQPASPNLLMDPLSAELRKSFGKGFPVAGIKKCLTPFSAETRILSDKLLLNSLVNTMILRPLYPLYPRYNNWNLCFFVAHEDHRLGSE